MPQLSESISRAILRVSDAAALQFESFSPEQKGCSSATLTLTPSLTRRLWPLTREHLPAPLFDGYASRVAARLPWEYPQAS